MPSIARCLKPPPAVQLIVMLWLTGCGMAGSDAHAACPPVVDYTASDQARAADELEVLPESVVIVRMLTDYTVMREQARSCHEVATFTSLR